MIIHTFLECKDYDFKGKTIVPFCTFATSTYQTLNDIVAATPDSQHLEGLGLRGAGSYSEATVKEWLDHIGISDIVAGIETLSAAKNGQQRGIYNLQGQLVTSLRGSAKGLYIMDGQKYLVK